MSDPTIDAIEKALDMVCDLCKPKNIAGAKEWIMSIPAQPDKDPDLVIANGLREAKKRIATLEKQRDNPWISVDERLPEEDLDCRSVLAVAKKKVAYIDYYRRVDDHWGSGNNVTHWMPIPTITNQHQPTPTNTNRGINMKTELIEKLIGMLLDGETPTGGEKEMIGDYVIVRCRDAGVHAGTLVSYEGREVVLKNSRRLWYWKCANNQHSLSGVAEEGITQESKIPGMVRKIVLGDACEIISTSDKCQRSIQDAKVHKTV